MSDLLSSVGLGTDTYQRYIDLHEMEPGGNKYYHHSEITISQLSTAAICGQLDLNPTELKGEVIADVGSGFCQQFARDLEEQYGATVISIDPNLPHTDQYKLLKLENDIKGHQADALRHNDLVSAGHNIEVVEKLALFFAMQGIEDPFSLSLEEMQKALAEFVELSMNWPKKAYGKALAGDGLSLPLADRSVDRIVATTSIPYALSKEQIPYMLAEACRVLRGKGKTAHFWPIVAETDIYTELELSEIRDLVKKARATAQTKEEKEALSGFGLSIHDSDFVKEEFARIKHLLPTRTPQSKSLVLTRKIK